MCLAIVASAGCGVDAKLLERTPTPDDAGNTVADARGPFVAGPGAQLAAGEAHTCALVSETIHCWGNNQAAQVAPPSGAAVMTPKTVALGEPAVALCAGESHSCALTGAGSVWCWGGNDQGQLGRGAGSVDPSPARANLPLPVTTFACGIQHNCGVLADGTLWCWGSSMESQLGVGIYDDIRPDPIQVGTDRDWMLVAAGQGHTCGLRKPGRLYCWGRNTGVQLGLGPGAPQNVGTPARVGGDEDWIAVSLRQDGTCALKAGGSLHCWGSNTGGQLGEAGAATEAPAPFGMRNDWRVVRAGTFHSCALTAKGELACWGRNIEGQLAFGDFATHVAPPDATLPGRWLEATVGRFHTCARAETGSIACAGKNAVSELGVGRSDYAIPNFMTLDFTQ
jgi:alpha-tubulin suppressor-like RCC1 family protein